MSSGYQPTEPTDPVALSHVEKLARDTRVALIVGISGAFLLYMFGFGTSNVDPADGTRSGLKFYTDNYTKCQYLSIDRGSGITPRYDATGRQMGCTNPIAPPSTGVPSN